MSPAQQLVLRWFEFSLAAAILLVVARLILSRLKQPADRINLILLSFAMAALIPVLGVLVPLPRVELGLVEEVRVNTELPVGLPEIHPLPVKSPSYGPVEIPKELPDFGEPVVPLNSLPSVASNEETQPVPQSFVGFLSIPFWEVTAGLLILLHLLVAGYFLVEWWISFRVLRGICKRAQGPQPSLLAVWQEISQGKNRSVRLLVSEEIPGPIAFGFWQSTIVIPESIAAGNADSLRFCLKHEWTHIDNGDLRALGFAWVCQFLLWIQPLFWLLRRDLRVCQDFLADHQAAGEGLDRVEYSQLLLDCTKLRLTRPIPGTIAFFDRSSHLMKRVRMILESDFTLRLKSHRWFCLGAGAGLLGLAVLFGAVRLHGAGSGAETNTSLPEAVITPSENQDGRAEDKEFKWIRGTVVDQKGQPISGAKLALPLGLMSVKESLQTKSDSNGKFEIPIRKTWLNPGPKPPFWTLWVYAQGFTVSGESIYPLINSSKEKMELKIILNKGKNTQLLIIDVKDSPVIGAKIQPYLYHINKRQSTFPKEFIEHFSGKTDAKGVIQLPDINPELLNSIQIQEDKYGIQRITVNNLKDSSNHTVRLKETGSIKGRLISDHPEWVRGVKIHLQTKKKNEKDFEFDYGVADITTDQNGHFEFPNIAVGEFSATVQLDPKLPVLAPTQYATLRADSNLNLEIPLLPATKVRGELRVKSKGTPVAGAVIVFGNIGPVQEAVTAVTDAIGKYEGKALTGQVAFQILTLPNENLIPHGIGPAMSIKIPAGAKEFDFPPLEVLEVRQQKGKLVGAKSQPLSGFQICVKDKAPLAYSESDSNGFFDIKIPEGVKVEFEIFSKKYGSEIVKVVKKEPFVLQSVLEPEPEKEAESNKKQDVNLKGRVLLAGKPVSGINLTLFRGIPVTTSSGQGMRSEKVFETSTDVNGDYRLIGLKAGDSYRIQVNSRDPVADPEWIFYQSPYFPQLKQSAVGDITLPDLKLRKLTQTLSGQVVDPDGKPVSGAQIVATMRKTFTSIPRLTDNGPPPWTTTDKEGRFRLEQLPDEPLGIMAYLSPKGGTAIPFPAKTNVELNQKDIRIILDPSLVEEDK